MGETIAKRFFYCRNCNKKVPNDKHRCDGCGAEFNPEEDDYTSEEIQKLIDEKGQNILQRAEQPEEQKKQTLELNEMDALDCSEKGTRLAGEKQVWKVSAFRYIDGKEEEGEAFTLDSTRTAIGRKYFLNSNTFDGDRDDVNESIKSVSRDNAILCLEQDVLWIQYDTRGLEPGKRRSMIKVNGIDLKEGKRLYIGHGARVMMGNNSQKSKDRCVCLKFENTRIYFAKIQEQVEKIIRESQEKTLEQQKEPLDEFYQQQKNSVAISKDDYLNKFFSGDKSLWDKLRNQKILSDDQRLGLETAAFFEYTLYTLDENEKYDYRGPMIYIMNVLESFYRDNMKIFVLIEEEISLEQFEESDGSKNFTLGTVNHYFAGYNQKKEVYYAKKANLKKIMDYYHKKSKGKNFEEKRFDLKYENARLEEKFKNAMELGRYRNDVAHSGANGNGNICLITKEKYERAKALLLEDDFFPYFKGLTEFLMKEWK